MATRAPARVLPYARWHEHFVCVRGEIARVRVEHHPQPEKIDHVWIDLRAGAAGLVQLSLSTFSRQSLAAGFDPRVRLGVLAGRWERLPAPGLQRAEPLDYAEIEQATPVEFELCERRVLEEALLEKAGRAVFAEAWGDFYVRGGRTGLHQIHSRRASHAVKTDHRGRDGALKFYYSTGESDLMLFKFAGQP